MRAEPLLSAFSCQTNDKPTTTTVPVRDDLGRPHRVLALAPGMTEMLYAVANTSTSIARTQADDYSAAALRKPVVNSYPLDMERRARRWAARFYWPPTCWRGGGTRPPAGPSGW